MYFWITISRLQHVCISLFFWELEECSLVTRVCWIPGAFSSVVKLLQHSADCSPPLGAKLHGTVCPFPIVFLACWLIKHKKYLTVILLLVLILWYIILHHEWYELNSCLAYYCSVLQNFFLTLICSSFINLNHCPFRITFYFTLISRQGILVAEACFSRHLLMFYYSIVDVSIGQHVADIEVYFWDGVLSCYLQIPTYTSSCSPPTRLPEVLLHHVMLCRTHI